jgi:hypothetical protein
MQQDVGDRIAIGVSRVMTRRRFFGNTLRTSLALGGALATPWVMFDQRRAEAASCGPTKQYSRPCDCASTAACPSVNCYDGGCNGIRKRCNAWTSADSTGNYCWCSPQCCYSCVRGYYVCCDCWTGGSGSCATGSGACICSKLVYASAKCC